MIKFTVTLNSAPRPDAPGRGYFHPDTFSEYIGRRVDVTGLDPAYVHILTAVENTEDGLASTLTIQSHAEEGPDLAASLSVRWDTPTVEVRAHVDGEHLVTARLDAPLQAGQTVRAGEQLYNVLDVSHPARQEDGTTTGPDYQHAELHAIDTPPPVRDLGANPLGMLLAGG